MQSRRTKALDIPQRVKDRVFARDGGACVVCGSRVNVMPNAHVVSRAQGGLGIEENIVTLCTSLSENRCHYYFDNGTAAQREVMREIIEGYLKERYPGWNREMVQYRKGGKER